MALYGYVRVSTVEQAEEGRSSLSDQERRVRGCAMMRGGEIAEIFRDAGVSGSIPLLRRPAGGEMASRLVSGDIVIAAKMDRLFRSALDAIGTAEDFARRGIGLVLADVGPDPVTENGSSKLFFSMLAAFAEFERGRIAERMNDGRKGKAARGGHVGGDAPYGYRKVGLGRDSVLVPEAAEQEVIRRVRVLRRNGLSYRDIAEDLGALEKRSRTGGAFLPMQIKRMIGEV